MKSFIENDPILKERDRVVKEYCEKKGWKVDELSFEQIKEIRDLPEWKNPVKSKED